MNSKGSGGALFTRNKGSEKAPDMGGDITIEGDELDYMIRCAEQGKPVKLDVSAWKKRTRDGGAMLSLSVQIPYDVRSQGSQQRQSRDIQTTRGTYRSGRDNGPSDNRDGYERREGYGRPHQNHATQMGGEDRDFPPRSRQRNPLDDL